MATSLGRRSDCPAVVSLGSGIRAKTASEDENSRSGDELVAILQCQGQVLSCRGESEAMVGHVEWKSRRYYSRGQCACGGH